MKMSKAEKGRQTQLDSVMTNEQIAKSLNIPLHTVRYLIHSGMRKLRAQASEMKHKDYFE